WTRHEVSLTRAIADSTGTTVDDIAAAALARFSLEALDLAGEQPSPRKALAATFDHLRNGWGDYGRRKPETD
ncbi:MAG: TetR/AcrR family transcriptional regulator, partial [Nakamurella sp.]